MYDQAYLDDERPKGPRRRSRHVLTIRMLVAKVGWLDGVHRWRNGGVRWETATGSLAPGAADLSRAQRTLNKIKSYPVSAQLALGDVEEWLNARQSRLELAKRLVRLSGDDLLLDAQAARSGKAPAIERLAALLAAEALCVNRLPISPSAALVACGERALPAAIALMEDNALMRSVRALAALTVGAIQKVVGARDATISAPMADRWLRRAHRWGRAHGLPAEPALVVALLAESEETAHRVLASQGGRLAFALEPELLRELLASGVPPGRVAELAEAAAEAQSVVERLLDHRELLPGGSQHRKHTADVLDGAAAKAVELTRDLYAQLARSTGDPAALRSATSVSLGILTLGPYSAYAAAMARQCLELSLELPPRQQVEWLRLLADEQERLWRDDPEQPRSSHETEAGMLTRRLDNAFSRRVTPCHRLLRLTGSPAIVREALELGVEQQLPTQDEVDNDAYRLLLSAAREFGNGSGSRFLWNLGQVVTAYSTGTAARAALDPLFAAVRRAPQESQADLLDELVDQLLWLERKSAGLATRLARLAPPLLRFNPGGGAWTVSHPAINVAVALDQACPETAGEWLERLLAEIPKWIRADPAIADRMDDLPYAVGLGLGIAGGDLPFFLTLVRETLSRPASHALYKLQNGLDALATYPALRASVAALFSDQPHRCLGLLLRLGLATRLDVKILGPLNDLDVSAGSGEQWADEWTEIVALGPALAVLAAEYRRSLLLCGRAAPAPAGVKRALSLPQRLRGELAYLEHRARAEELPDTLAARVLNLRARLADAAALRESVRREVTERLALAANEARVAAAEHQVAACFRARLAQLASPLPDDLVMDDDWFNAALLSTGIEHNRKLLARLLRGCLEGDRRWPERHPENVRFLEALAARNVDVPLWLGTHPRRYRCAEAQGGWLHLRLERDPLRILHMGNYFDTCLSSDGCNSFSTVTNACELNKRVLYASDASGRVVGRKLIALNEEGDLVGFRTYTALSNAAGNRALTAIVRDYVGRFAERCGLKLAEKGPVPRLFAEAWYDDGIMSWEEPAIYGARKDLGAAGSVRDTTLPPDEALAGVPAA